MNKILETVSERKELIFTGVGILGMGGAVALSWKAGTKASRLLEEAKEEKGEDLTKKEVIIKTASAWGPVVALYLLSAACIANGERIAVAKNVALTEGYILATDAMREYKNSVIEHVGQEKEEEIAMDANQKIVTNHPTKHGYIINTGKGNTLCMDSLSGQMFYSEWNDIVSAVNAFNSMLNEDTFVSANELMFLYGINEMSAAIDISREDGLLDVYSSSIVTRDNEPCLVINYRNMRNDI